MSQKQIFVNSVTLIEFPSGESVPTVLCWNSDDDVRYGSEALASCDDSDRLNENFKLSLGAQKPGEKIFTKQQFITANGGTKSATALTKKFFDLILAKANLWLSQQGLPVASKLLVSEPLSFHLEKDDTDWLPNYRKNIRRVLPSSFVQVDFLPEPFAVFQYYRYGLKHPSVSQSKKYITMVIDFGGGTFDVSIIETTKAGELSASGKHSRPLAGASGPVGGFYVNQMISEYLIMSVLSDKAQKDLARKAIENHARWKKGELDISTLNERNQACVRWHERLSRQVEDRKIHLVSIIPHWGLEKELRCAVPFDIPSDPFDLHCERRRVSIRGDELRQIFLEKIWPTKLRPIVRDAIKRAERELEGRTINLVLLSGGSANLRWTEQCLRRDYGQDLDCAEFVSLAEDFQHIVAKGLAIECARRFYNPDTEFRSVTYNPLFLVLEPDERGTEIPRYQPLQDFGAIKKARDGQLLPSASALKTFIGETLRWKVKLKHPPKRRLEYHFLRSTLDTEDYDSLYNADRTVFTEPGTKFDSGLRVELDVSEDGTCVPRFVYKMGRDGKPAIFKEGKPFCIDVTVDAEVEGGDAFLGFDFGSSNSSISYVTHDAISLIEQRKSSTSWLQLSELASTLPHPVSGSLRSFLAARNPDTLAKEALSCIENLLAFTAYWFYAEYRALGSTRRSGMLKELMANKRSVGPLKKFLTELLKKLPGESEPFRAFDRYFRESGLELDKAVNLLNGYKHDKVAAEEVGVEKIIEGLGNALNSSLGERLFGHFEDVRKVGFGSSYSGVFRVATNITPFYRILEYEGREPFAEQEAFIVDKNSGRALCLTPLVYWAQCAGRGMDECLFFDQWDARGEPSYVPVGSHDKKALSGEVPAGLKVILVELKEDDGGREAFENLSFRTWEEW